MPSPVEPCNVYTNEVQVYRYSSVPRHVAHDLLRREDLAFTRWLAVQVDDEYSVIVRVYFYYEPVPSFLRSVHYAGYTDNIAYLSTSSSMAGFSLATPSLECSPFPEHGNKECRCQR